MDSESSPTRSHLKKSCSYCKISTSLSVMNVNNNRSYATNSLKTSSFSSSLQTFIRHSCDLCHSTDYVILKCYLLPEFASASNEYYKAQNSAKYSSECPRNGSERSPALQNNLHRNFNSSRKNPASSDNKTKMLQISTRPRSSQ